MLSRADGGVTAGCMGTSYGWKQGLTDTHALTPELAD
ncbi:hypothetical protein BMS3Bbin11_00948 [bacterium BMS3Bbin11]|nr:hypothetical protein BMS3Bbin11_00948 [bacterium BMS3Bbin11]GMT39904.1 MAG: hypothetical protein IEMM0001_0639 [bacterium]